MGAIAAPEESVNGGLRGLLLPVAGGVLMGAAHLHPILAPLAWMGVGVFAVGLGRLEGRRPRGVAILAAVWCSVFLSQIWLCLTISRFMAPLVDMERAPLWLSGLAWAFAAGITACHRGLPVIVAALLFRRASMRWWLPPALLAGEALNGALGFTMADLMHSQWAVPAVLRSVALIGLPATALLLTYGAVAAAEALVGHHRGLLVLVPIALWLGLLPPIPAADDALAGVAAVHLANFDQRPKPEDLPAGVDLVVWPEASLRGSYDRREGPQPSPLPVEALVAWAGPQHLVNLRLAWPGQTQNAIGITNRVGQVTALRGKSSLVPWGERPYGGLDPLFSIDVRGETPPLLATFGPPVVPTICYEVYERALFVEGAALGGGLLVNVANDGAYGPTALGIRQAIGVLALRAAETHRPAARASLSGQAALISSTGALLAVSAVGTSGLLTAPPRRVPPSRAPARPSALLTPPFRAPTAMVAEVASGLQAPGESQP